MDISVEEKNKGSNGREWRPNERKQGRKEWKG